MTALTLNEQTWSELTAREVFRLSFCVETCMKKRSYLLGTEESEHLVFIFLWFIFQLLRRFYFIYNQMLKTEALMNNSFFFPTPYFDNRLMSLRISLCMTTKNNFEVKFSQTLTPLFIILQTSLYIYMRHNCVFCRM